jgi:hypothetical protein
MSTEIYFVRDRGRVEGPYTRDQVRNLFSLGRIGWDCQLSSDREQWKPASEFEGVLAPVERKVSKAQPKAKVAQPKRSQSSPPPEAIPEPSTTKVATPPLQLNVPRPAPEDAAGIEQAPVVSHLAVASFVFGILGTNLLFFIGSALAVACGHIALSDIRRARGGLVGYGLAVSGLVMGYTIIVGALLVGAFLVIVALLHASN